MLSIGGEEEITLSLLTGKFMLVAMDTYTIRYEMLFLRALESRHESA